MFKIPIVNHSLKYNPTFDGIRGIAIISVLLFHIYPQYFFYGYLGVDLFFILSGYLITNIIYIKLENNTFSFKEFYRNRIRRIFPAVIIVLLFTLFIGWLFLFPSEFENLGKHIKSSAFFYQNIRLIDEVGYWDKSALLKPLLHFWSLSIEEQFYLFWPFLIFLIYKFRLNLIYSFSLLLIISFSLRYFIDIDTFYHSLARFWELILGGLLYSIGLKYKYELPNIKIFSNKYLVFFGLISFPLYLWHYVLISYMYIVGLDVVKYGFIIIFLSILLSYLIYRYIEIYIRKQSSYKLVIFLFMILLSIGFIGKYIYKHNGLVNRVHLENNNLFQKQFIREPSTNSLGVNLISNILNKKAQNDYIKSTTNKINSNFIAIIGDSHAHTSYPGFAKLAKKYGYDSLLLSNSSCPPYIGGKMGENNQDILVCQNKINNIYNLLNSTLDIKKIIFTTRMGYIYDSGFGIEAIGNKKWNYHFEEYFINKNIYNQKETFFEVLENTFKYFNSKEKYKFYYLMANPELGFNPENCMVRPFKLFSSTCKLKIDEFINRQKEYRNFVYTISKKYKNIIILDPKNLYCDDKYCYAIIDGKMMYADDDHHSIEGSIIQAKYFESKIFNDK